MPISRSFDWGIVMRLKNYLKSEQSVPGICLWTCLLRTWITQILDITRRHSQLAGADTAHRDRESIMTDAYTCFLQQGIFVEQAMVEN